MLRVLPQCGFIMRTYSLDSVIPLLDDVGGPMALYQSAYNANRGN